MKYLSVFMSVGAGELAWAWYFMSVAAVQPIRAGIWSSAIIAASAYTTVSYVADHRMVWVAMVAALIFTPLAMWLKNRKPEPKVSDIAAQIRAELLEETDEWETYK